MLGHLSSFRQHKTNFQFNLFHQFPSLSISLWKRLSFSHVRKCMCYVMSLEIQYWCKSIWQWITSQKYLPEKAGLMCSNCSFVMTFFRIQLGSIEMVFQECFWIWAALFFFFLRRRRLSTLLTTFYAFNLVRQKWKVCQ